MTFETVSSLATLVGGRVLGDADRRIVGVADLRAAGHQQIGFVRDLKYRELARASAAGALITPADLGTSASQIVVADVSVAFAKVALRFHPVPRAAAHAVHPSAVVHEQAQLESPVEIGANAVVGRARIGRGSVLMAGAKIGDGCTLGADCTIYPNAVLYHGVRLGARVIVHAGAVIGSDGFGYAKEGAAFVKVPQLGSVQIGDDVEIGANTTIDRGAFTDTRIGARTKIDNLCHVAHNVVMGEDCAVAGFSCMAGSTTLGDRVICAGHVAIGGHLEIVSDVRIAGNSCVLRDIRAAGDYMGHPIMQKRAFMRSLGTLRDIVQLEADVAELKRRLQAMGDGPA